jgi:hypothetical protein
MVPKLSIRADLLTAGNSAFRKCPAWVRQSLFRVNQLRELDRRRGESAFGKTWRRKGWLVKQNKERNGERHERLNAGQLGLPAKKMTLTKRGDNVVKKEVGSSGRIRTYNPSVNSRMLYH